MKCDNNQWIYETALLPGTYSYKVVIHYHDHNEWIPNKNESIIIKEAPAPTEQTILLRF